MVKQLIGSIRMHIKSMLYPCALFIGAWIFGTLGMSVIFWADETASSWFCLGTICALIAVSGIMVLFSWKYHQEFMLALSLGRTRKEIMITYALRQMLWVITAYVVIFLLYQLEGLYYQLIFPDKEKVFALGFLTDWRFVVPFIPGLVLLTMFLGAMYSRFGMKFWGVLYFVWIGSCLFVPRFVNHWEEYTGPFQKEIGAFAAWIFGIPPMAWIAVGLFAALGMVVIIVRFGMKQTVR